MNRPDQYLAALSGLILDLAKLARGIPTNPHSLLKFRVLKALAIRTEASLFVESGTFRGVTAARCARVFERVVTIELDAKLAGESQAYLRRFPNVEVLQGDAAELLPEALARVPEGRAVVFLDGHYSGGETALGSLAEPAIVELQTLAILRERLAAVVVDDFRLFGVEPGFPTKADLVSAAERLFPPEEFAITVSLDQLIVERVRRSL